MRPINGTADADQLLTASQVAHQFNVSRSTVSRWTSDGILTAVRIGTVLRYRRTDIERLLNEQAS